MILFGDYHTHTQYSDGVGTIEQNVKSAQAKGLKEVALTDHGFSHMAHGMKREQLEDYKQELAEAQKKYPDIKVLFGIESNIVGINGEIDINPSERDIFDVVLVGYHRTFKANNMKSFFKFWMPNTLGLTFSKKRRKQRNTMAYIKAIENNRIDIVAHLKLWCDVDSVQIAQVAAKHNTYIELNGKRVLFAEQEMQDMISTGVKFIINSDSHNPQGLGKANIGFNFAEKYNIPLNQLANVNKLPQFQNYIRNK